MNPPAEVAVAVEQIGRLHRARATIAVVGNPNAGKSALFNRLTGMHQKTANYPGVTVERRTGRCRLDNDSIDLIDLPGTFSLTPNAGDEAITVSVLFGRVDGTPPPDGILAVIDSTRLYQGLYLLQQLAELGLPLMVALTMSDAAEREGIRIDYAKLSALLGNVPVYPIVATTGRGFDELRQGLAKLPETAAPTHRDIWPELDAAVGTLHADLGPQGWKRAEIGRWLVEGDTVLDETGLDAPPEDAARRAEELRRTLFGSEPALAVEARARYRWIRSVLPEVVDQEKGVRQAGAKLVDWLNRPWISTVLFVLAMGIVFQAVFAWATVFMDGIDAGMSAIASGAQAILPEGMLASFVADGIIAGVGSVIIFLPQILILFLFIIVMEDTGYLARAAFLVDRAMRSIGLSGQSVIPLVSSFACAVPSIMATRVIPNRRDRIATILAAPFMTCSARLPVYALMIAAFVPSQQVAPLVNLQGLVLFGLYLLGILGGVGTALLLRSTKLRGERPAFILALPEYRLPNVRSVLVKLLDRARVFLRRAGTIIFAVAVIVWVLSYFPRANDIEDQVEADSAAAVAALDDEALQERLAEIENTAAAAQMEQSLLGRAGQLIEPVFTPLGWDWRVSAAVIAGFPAREVVVAVLGTIYAVGDEADEQTLSERLRSATWPDGSLVFTLPMVLGLLVFYAWCLQCAATLAIIKRETNSWGWAVFSWTYMTALAYVAALLIYQVGTALG